MEKHESAPEPGTKARKQYHIHCKPGDVAPYVLVSGAHERVLNIEKRLEGARQIAFYREYCSVSGEYKGINVSALSSGIGGPSLSIAMEEMASLGCHTFIKVGTTGAIQEPIQCGDLIIVQGAVRLDGTSKNYAPPEYPAFADLAVTLALIAAAETLGFGYHLGVAATTDSFYVGQGRQGYKGYLPVFQENLPAELQMMNVTNFDMETSPLFVISRLFGLRAGNISAVVINRATDEYCPGDSEERAIDVALEAVKLLKEWDELQHTDGKRPSIADLIK
jgi:uridine phosphorylase